MTDAEKIAFLQQELRIKSEQVRKLREIGEALMHGLALMVDGRLDQARQHVQGAQRLMRDV